jgi:hypothetical protein
MGKKPLVVLKAGLTQLKETMKTCKDTLSKCLFNKEHISEEDKHWLDNKANFVDEDAVIDLLDKASDYERASFGCRTRFPERLQFLSIYNSYRFFFAFRAT